MLSHSTKVSLKIFLISFIIISTFCEGIKEHVSTNELVKGDICYDYGLFDGCTKVTITQSAQYSNIIDSNSNFDLKKLSSYWYTLWLVSCSFNIVFAIIFAIMIAIVYYKRYGYSYIINKILSLKQNRGFLRLKKRLKRAAIFLTRNPRLVVDHGFPKRHNITFHLKKALFNH